ncbi:hypothetical protein [Bradyrhizobium sp.]|uniref:hypothetical protein n=2 Tax=Bradyrhizobium sp. TaxID=376 RepID=UPI001EBC509A|nr:hypothetical protein [Bradyrhizobium sp.]MBV9983265.1 hypothetical protein [Bradyrhizobium sp.]
MTTDSAFHSPTHRHLQRWALALDAVPHAMLSALLLLALAASILFLGAALWALATGWALPLTAPLRWFGLLAGVARGEPYFADLVLGVAAIGTLTTWLSVWRSRAEMTTAWDTRLNVILRWSGPPIVAAALLIGLGAMWAGIARPGDPHWANIGGLVPFSDANGHLAEAFYQTQHGTWTSWALRRPLAAAFRALLLFASGASFPAMLIVQACLLAAAACLAAHAVMIWRGIWAGLAFFGLSYLYLRTFAPTSLSEPLGLFWALLSIPFFIAAFRTRAAGSALIGFAMTSVALMTRMGSLFTIPALLLWLVWQFGRSVSEKLRIAILAIAIVGAVISVNTLLSRAFGAGGAETGSNFAYVLCGLSIGTGWEGCPAKLAERGERLTGDEAAIAKRLYGFAWQNLAAKPTVFLARLTAGVKGFLSHFPAVMWKGYAVVPDRRLGAFGTVLTVISLIGLAWLARRGTSEVEVTFWCLVGSSILLSSALIYLDDGARTLAASQPLIALFIAMGMSDPRLAAGQSEPGGRLVAYGALGLIIAALLAVSVPWTAHRLSSTQDDPKYRASGSDEITVAGGAKMSGFLVLADEAPLRADIPTLHVSDFEAVVAQSGVESYQGLIHPVSPALPFGFVFAAPLGTGMTAPNIFIVPAEVMESRDVQAWHFRLEPRAYKADAPGRYWFLVTRAEPWRQ